MDPYSWQLEPQNSPLYNLAMLQANDSAQIFLVKEFMKYGNAKVRKNDKYPPTVGSALVGLASYNSLVQRLAPYGFTFHFDRKRQTIYMNYPTLEDA